MHVVETLKVELVSHIHKLIFTIQNKNLIVVYHNKVHKNSQSFQLACDFYGVHLL